MQHFRGWLQVNRSSLSFFSSLFSSFFCFSFLSFSLSISGSPLDLFFPSLVLCVAYSFPFFIIMFLRYQTNTNTVGLCDTARDRERESGHSGLPQICDNSNYKSKLPEWRMTWHFAFCRNGKILHNIWSYHKYKNFQTWTESPELSVVLKTELSILYSGVCALQVFCLRSTLFPLAKHIHFFPNFISFVFSFFVELSYPFLCCEFYWVLTSILYISETLSINNTMHRTFDL